jgi:hypothetical protein
MDQQDLQDYGKTFGMTERLSLCRPLRARRLLTCRGVPRRGSRPLRVLTPGTRLAVAESQTVITSTVGLHPTATRLAAA